MSDINEIREKCLVNYELGDPVRRSSMVAFRDLFDPYCDEYKSIDNGARLEILDRMMNDGIIRSVLPFYHEFARMFREHERPDIANAAADGLALLIDYTLTNVYNI